ncbi:MAG: hypothetical protein R3F07_04955 [Opitutaceae bacterium]
MIAAIPDIYLTIVIFAFCTAFFVVLLWSMIRRPKNRVTAFTADNGSVTIARKALEDVIARTCESFPEIVRAKVAVGTSGGRMQTRIQLQLRESARIRDFSDRLRQQITAVLTGNLGMDDVGSMEFVVVGIAAEKTKAPPETELKAPGPKED